MSNYVKATNFATKDTLPSGNAGKIVKGTELDDEFNAIASAISSKADTASPAFTGTPTSPTATFGTNTTQLATTAFVQAALQALHPVGSIYINAYNSANPGTLLGFGTWVAFGAGRTLVSLDASNAAFDTAEETGGSANAIVVSHTHTFSGSGTAASAGSHQHRHQAGPHTVNWQGYSEAYGNFGGGTPDDGGFIYKTEADGAHTHSVSVSGTSDSSGSSGTNANLPPYIVVYMWKRTA